MRDLIGDALRFGLVGIANTALGLGIIAALDLGLHVNPHLANAEAYAVGVVISYFLTRRFVFRQATDSKATAPKYAVAMAVAFCVNQAVLFAAGKLLGAAPEMRLLAQVAAVCSYTVVNFVICRAWVFRAAPTPV
jgi:putative flippase GtrA